MSIRRRPLHPIDHQILDGAFGLLQLQSELLFQRLNDSGAGRIVGMLGAAENLFGQF